ncbi:MAG TPA: hypothetical protein VEK57_17015 [Thermoanaerobaculia bacterium]|nr:hypothetical protein [Thermoanaerobaculia bacterium]
MASHQLSFKVDFAELAGRTNRLIWRVTQLAAFALSAVDRVADEEFGELSMRGALIGLGPGHTPDPQTRIAFRQWIIGCALRDAVETTLVLLDDVRRICAIGRFSRRGDFPAQEWAADENAQREFHMLTLSQKLKCLTREFGLKLPKEKRSALFSLVAARNCLVHRLGIVGIADASSDGLLKVSWLGFEMRTVGPAGDRVIESLPGKVAADERLQVVARKRSRTFAIGQQVDFSTAEFTEVGVFLQIVSQTIAAITATVAALPVAAGDSQSSG